jgi:hypothetical protein
MIISHVYTSELGAVYIISTVTIVINRREEWYCNISMLMNTTHIYNDDYNNAQIIPALRKSQ